MKTALHSGKLGDVIYCLPALARMHGKLLLNCRLRRSKDRPLTLAQASQLVELADAAGYRAAVWDGRQLFDVDFDRFRDTALAFRWRHLVDCHWQLVASGDCPRRAWLRLEPHHLAPIIINRTSRYAATDSFAWELLDGADCVFVGLHEEWRTFCRQFFPVPFHPTESLLELASIIAGAELFVGNQSCPLAIAEGLDVYRCVEIRPDHPCSYPRTARGRTQLKAEDLEQLEDSHLCLLSA